MTLPAPTHRLARDGRSAYLSEDGAFIGAGTPLLERDAYGRWQPRPRAELERLLKLGTDGTVDLSWRLAKLAGVVRALNAGDRSLAAIALVQAELPSLPDDASALRMAKADGLAKAYNQNEPRMPPGSGRASGR